MQASSEKLRHAFPGRVVSKALVRDAGLPRLPLFVVEHLVANFVEGRPNVSHEMSEVREGVAQRLPESDNRGLVKAALLREGEVVLIDKLSVEVNLKTGQLVGSLTFLGENKVEVLTSIVDEHPRLLTGGLWGSFRVQYITKTGKKGAVSRSIMVVGIHPFQSNTPDLDEFSRARSQFTLNEWIDVLLASVGYEPMRYDQSTKETLLLRLLPGGEPQHGGAGATADW